jgi:ubiquitin-conjugating enzyme E2 variant
MLFCIFLQILLAYYAAEFLSGFAHWFEDTYLDAYSPWPLAAIGADNDHHHRFPRAMVAYRWWDTISTTIPFVIVLFLFCAALLGTNAFTWALSLILLFANQVHKLAHMRPAELPWPVRALQNAGVLISPQQHSQHHRGSFDSNYCAVSGHLNGVLDGLGFWRWLEGVLARLLYVAPNR